VQKYINTKLQNFQHLEAITYNNHFSAQRRSGNNKEEKQGVGKGVKMADMRILTFSVINLNGENCLLQAHS